jgi:hypothetical protein
MNINRVGFGDTRFNNNKEQNTQGILSAFPSIKTDATIIRNKMKSCKFLHLTWPNPLESEFSSAPGCSPPGSLVSCSVTTSSLLTAAGGALCAKSSVRTFSSKNYHML